MGRKRSKANIKRCTTKISKRKKKKIIDSGLYRGTRLNSMYARALRPASNIYVLIKQNEENARNGIRYSTLDHEIEMMRAMIFDDITIKNRIESKLSLSEEDLLKILEINGKINERIERLSKTMERNYMLKNGQYVKLDDVGHDFHLLREIIVRHLKDATSLQAFLDDYQKVFGIVEKVVN
jgi:hypothetical protein